MTFLISLRDLRRARAAGMKYCVGGTKTFLEQHNLSWQEFKKPGLPADVLLATGDSMAIKLVDFVLSQGGAA